jgi:tRNA (guanine37-N1)-methyltransferase
VIVDAVARLVPGVVGDEQSVAEDSFSRGLLDFRPPPAIERTGIEVLLSGTTRIRRWRKRGGRQDVCTAPGHADGVARRGRA